MRIIFFGSDDFAVVNFNALLNAGHQIPVCVTSPDKPKGRGMHVAVSPVKEFALIKKIPVLQPADVRDPEFVADLKKNEADLFVVIAYGQFLPTEVLAIPKICAINSHGSLLPKYRGAAPINWAIINGEAETGITIIRINPAMDAGDIVFQERLKIQPRDTAVTLRPKLACLSATCLVKTVAALGNNTAAFVPQQKEQVTFAPKLKKEHGIINWNSPAVNIERLVRGLLPWPAAHTVANGKMVKVLESEVIDDTSGGRRPGEVSAVSAQGITVACGEKQLLLKTVHPESGKPMPAADFSHGHALRPGTIMG